MKADDADEHAKRALIFILLRTLIGVLSQATNRSLLIGQKVQDVWNIAGLFPQPGMVEKFLKAANGKSPQHAHTFRNLIGDRVQAQVLVIIKGVQIQKIGAMNVPMGAPGFAGEHGFIGQDVVEECHNRFASVVIQPDIGLEIDLHL